MKYVARLVGTLSLYAVDAECGDPDTFTVNPALAYTWDEKEACEKWISDYGNEKWEAVLL